MANAGVPLPVPPASGGAYPARPGNLVRFLVDGIPAFRRIGEAVGRARHSVWLTVAFYADDFSFPDGRGGLFDVLDDAASRGVDVRVLCWRPNAESAGYGRAFSGTGAERALLHARGARFGIRWDRGHAGFIHHQKSWVIDAGQPSETAFVGGINLTAKALGSPGHVHGGRHDLYVELAGPSATDVHHNFVQRWNEASERHERDGAWGPSGAGALPFPSRASSPRGTSLVQVQRMIHSGRYTDSTPAPGGPPHDIAAGEHAILEQYGHAIAAARSSIYIENQALPVPMIARRLEQALQRGVEVVLVVPAEPEAHARAARLDPVRAEPFAWVEALGRYPAFTLAGLYRAGEEGQRTVCVHAKAMLVDDAWATAGSCNLHYNSLNGHSEMNVSLWDGGAVRALRRELLKEHLGQDTGMLDDRAALRHFRQIATRNRRKLMRGEAALDGLAVALRPADYARAPPASTR